MLSRHCHSLDRCAGERRSAHSFCSQRTHLRRSSALPLLTLLLAGLALSDTVNAQSIIDNGTVQLGIQPQGNLIVGGIGLTFLGTGGEALAPGCACEGWGVTDFGTALFGMAGESFGYANLGTPTLTVSGTGTHSSSTGSAAITSVDVLNGATAAINVRHEYAPSASANLYQVNVTLQNLQATAVADMRYRRAMDWDVPPTEFREFVTIQGWPATRLVASSDDGFATGNPNVPLTSISGSSVVNGNFTDSGPDDHGAAFDFSFGTIASGASVGFTIFYGAAASEADALAALAAVGAEVYSLGQPSTPDGPTLGTPNTFIFGFAGVGGTPIGGGAALFDFVNAFRDTAFIASKMSTQHLGLRFDGRLGGGERTVMRSSLSGPSTADAGASPVSQRMAIAPEMAEGRMALGAGDDTPFNVEQGNVFNIPGLRFFITGSGSFGNRDGSPTELPFRFRAKGITAGLDLEIRQHGPAVESMLIGAAYGFTDVSADFAGKQSELDLDSDTITLYGGIGLRGGVYTDASVAFSRLDYRHLRESMTGILYSGSADGDMFSGHWRIGWDTQGGSIKDTHHPRFSWGPYARLDYANAKIEEFSDASDTGPGLTIVEQNASSLRTETGLRGTYWFGMGAGFLGLHGKVAYQHEWLDGSDIVTQLTAGGLTLDGAISDPARGALAVGAGVSVKGSENFIMRIDYDGTLLNKDAEQHSIVGRMRAAF